MGHSPASAPWSSRIWCWRMLKRRGERRRRTRPGSQGRADLPGTDLPQRRRPARAQLPAHDPLPRGRGRYHRLRARGHPYWTGRSMRERVFAQVQTVAGRPTRPDCSRDSWNNAPPVTRPWTGTIYTMGMTDFILEFLLSFMEIKDFNEKLFRYVLAITNYLIYKF